MLPWEELAAFVKLNPAATLLEPESHYELDLTKPSPGTGQYTIAELLLRPPHESQWYEGSRWGF